MSNLNLKTKILLLVLTPLAIMCIMLTCIAIYQANQLGKENLNSFSEKIYELRRNELKNYTEMARSSVQHIYNSDGKYNQESIEQAKTILRNLAYGSDGYIFAYDYKGTNVVLPTKPAIEGKNLWDIKDKDGVYLIRELVSNARNGGGYTNYVWDKPSKGKAIDKVSYSLGLKDWEWMIGTGLYVDDLEDAIKGVQLEVDSNIEKTWQLIIALAFLSIVIVSFLGFRFTVSQGALADEKLQLLSKKAVEGQEEERARVARELQKGISKVLIATRAKIEKIANNKILEDSSLRNDFILTGKALNTTIKEIYRISGELRPEALDNLGLYSAIEKLSSETSKKEKITIRYKHAGSEDRIRSELETAVYRIIQEALNNIKTHSQASSVTIKTSARNSKLSISIQDNGSGFNIREISGKGNKAGIGIVDMRIRTESFGGNFTIFSSEGTGTIIKIDIPI